MDVIDISGQVTVSSVSSSYVAELKFGCAKVKSKTLIIKNTGSYDMKYKIYGYPYHDGDLYEELQSEATITSGSQVAKKYNNYYQRLEVYLKQNTTGSVPTATIEFGGTSL